MSNRGSRESVRCLVDLIHRFALAYLLQKRRRGRLNASLFGMSIEDLALDCIADLFQRDDDGSFPRIRSYFESREWRTLDEAELTVAVRRLAFRQVNEGLFRRYRECDTGLSRIIRNVKLAAKNAPGVTLERMGRDLYIVVGPVGSPRASLPLYPSGIVESYLASRIGEGDGVPSAVETLRVLIQRETSYANRFPVVELAKALRGAYRHLQTDDESTQEVYRPDEVVRQIEESAEEVQAEKRGTYVESGKVDRAAYSAYFKAVRKALSSDYVSGSLPVASYMDALSEEMPDLTKEKYARCHRNVLEYLVKLTRDRLLSRLREDRRVAVHFCVDAA